MEQSKEQKEKWYTVRARILDMSSKQLAAMCLTSMFMILAFLLVAQYLPAADRPGFLRSTVPMGGGMFLASSGA